MFDTDETPALPTLSEAAYEKLEQLVTAKNVDQAATALGEELQQIGDWNGVFYARLLQKRVALGVSPFPSGASTDLPASTHEEYENAIREAGRYVGGELLKQGDVKRAWFFFNMLGEPGAVYDYLARLSPAEGSDIQPLIEVALYHGAHPIKGFQWVVDHYGICNAITTFSAQDFSKNPDAKQEMIRSLVRALHAQLRERLVTDLSGQGKEVPGTASITDIVVGNPEIFNEGSYHIDTSHLSSVCQFALDLENCPEVAQAKELCIYGKHLAEGLQYPGDVPFDRTYADYEVMLDLVAGKDIEAGIKHFESKIQRGLDEDGNTYPVQIYVNILLKFLRLDEAVVVAKKYLATETRPMACPSVYELCQQANDYTGLMEVAKKRGDGINFLAGLIQRSKA